MGVRAKLLNRIVATLLPLFLTCAAALAEDQAKLDTLFARLQSAGAAEAGRIEKEIWIEWSKSGSPTLDLLLQRGQDALNLGDTTQAIEHFTALIDHDPGFAEGWNARATAFYQAGDFGPSLYDIGKTLTLNPRHFGAISGLAMIMEGIGRPEKAIEAYKAALALHPHLAGATEAVKRLEAQEAGQEL